MDFDLLIIANNLEWTFIMVQKLTLSRSRRTCHPNSKPKHGPATSKKARKKKIGTDGAASFGMAKIQLLPWGSKTQKFRTEK